MLDQQVDGVASNDKEARQTIQRIAQFARITPTIYLPTHDPESGKRLIDKSVVTIEEHGEAR